MTTSNWATAEGVHYCVAKWFSDSQRPTKKHHYTN